MAGKQGVGGIALGECLVVLHHCAERAEAVGEGLCPADCPVGLPVEYDVDGCVYVGQVVLAAGAWREEFLCVVHDDVAQAVLDNRVWAGQVADEAVVEPLPEPAVGILPHGGTCEVSLYDRLCEACQRTAPRTVAPFGREGGIGLLYGIDGCLHALQFLLCCFQHEGIRLAIHRIIVPRASRRFVIEHLVCKRGVAAIACEFEVPAVHLHVVCLAGRQHKPLKNEQNGRCVCQRHFHLEPPEAVKLQRYLACEAGLRHKRIVVTDGKLALCLLWDVQETSSNQCRGLCLSLPCHPDEGEHDGDDGALVHTCLSHFLYTFYSIIVPLKRTVVLFHLFYSFPLFL